MTRRQQQPWRGAPQPVTPVDSLFMQNLLAGVRRVREQATAPRPMSRPGGGPDQDVQSSAGSRTTKRRANNDPE